MRKITDGLKYWGQLLLLPVYGLSFLMPRDKKIWLFGSTFGRRFADNPRYMYLYVSQHKEEFGIRPIWISHDEKIVKFLNKNGYEAYMYHSLKGIWYALRGKVYLFDNYSKDINFWQSAGSLKINMWHGIPLKKIQADNIFDKFRHPKNLFEKLKNFPRNISDEKPSHYVLTTSENLKTIFSSAFRTKNVFTSGYPRTDYLISKCIDNIFLKKEKTEFDFVQNFKEIHGDSATVIYYMPTFRDSEINFFDIMDLDELQKFLSEYKILFCVKLHPKSKLKKEFLNIKKKKFKNIFVVDADSDPYVLLKITDVLVTDYSSIYFDFLLVDKPIIFFDYDKEEYIKKSRELYFDYEDMTPGKKVKNMKELMEAVKSYIKYRKNDFENVIDEYSTDRERVRNLVFDEPDKIAVKGFINEIKNILQ